MEVGAEVTNRQEAQPREMDFRQKLEDRFQLAFTEVYRRGGQEEGTPRVRVKPFYSAHRTREDLIELMGEFAERDKSQDSIHLYIPEALGWTKKTLGLFTEVSFGKMSPEELDKRLSKFEKHNPAYAKNIRDVYYFHIPIIIIDASARHKITKDSKTAWNLEPPYEGDFQQALDYTRAFLFNLAKHVNRREHYMLSQITPEKVEKLLGTYPGLVGNKTELNILMSLGLGHAPMPTDYSNHSFTNEGIIKSKFGKPVDDELAAKIFLESFIDKYLSSQYGNFSSSWLTNDSRKLAKFKRIFVGQMNREDAERIFNDVKSSVIKWGRVVYSMDDFGSFLKDNGFQIPKPENLGAYLENPMPRQLKSA